MRIDNEHDAFDAMLCELHRARRLYPTWPADLVHAAAVVMEEAGEVVKGCNDLQWHSKGSRDAIVTEAVQLGAMAVRFLCDTAALRRDDNRATAVTWRDLVTQQDAEIQALRAENARLIAMLQMATPTSPGKTHMLVCAHYAGNGSLQCLNEIAYGDVQENGELPCFDLATETCDLREWKQVQP